MFFKALNHPGYLSTSSKEIPAKTTILKDRTNEDLNKLLKGLLEDNRKKDEEIAKMKAMNQKWRLETASERKKLEQQQQQQQQQQQRLQQLQQQQQQQLRQQQQQPQQQPQQHQRQQRYDPYHYLDNATFDFGDGMTIPSHESRRAFDAKTPAKFIKIMSHAVWGTENLSQRVVRKQKNTRDRRQLSPRKKELLQTHYRHYLQEQNYSVEKFNIEVKEVTVNKYLDQAIQSAKKINNS
ncbi:GSCOCG00012262001-RA-CDS [Cotesia congregata]|nr:GSCOCG00012262001-RA-CDS [Cotesia congregata]